MQRCDAKLCTTIQLNLRFRRIRIEGLLSDCGYTTAKCHAKRHRSSDHCGGKVGKSIVAAAIELAGAGSLTKVGAVVFVSTIEELTQLADAIGDALNGLSGQLFRAVKASTGSTLVKELLQTALHTVSKAGFQGSASTHLALHGKA